MKCIHEYLEDCLSERGGDPYIFTKNGGVFLPRTFGETVRDVRGLAKSLSHLGFSGKRVYIFGENSYQWMVCDLAAMGYSAVSVPLDKEWTAFDLENILKQTEKAAFFYSDSRKELIAPLMEKYKNISFFSLSDDFDRLLNSSETLPDTQLIPRRDMEKTVKIIFTSGTTSTPKAIPLSQRNMFTNWDTLYRRTPMTDSDRSYVFLPLSHVYSGIANFLYTIISGMKLYLCSDMREINEDIIAIRPTVICTVPILLEKMYSLMTDELLEALRSVRFLYTGGSFTRPELRSWFTDNGVCCVEAYGTSESSSVIALSKVVDGKAEKEMTVFENLTVKILDPDSSGEGEIAVRGGSVSCGYLDFPGNSFCFDENGFYHTGDLGRLDSENHLYVSGRKKRTLITPDGENVYADEIEKLITENPDIHAAKVFIENGEIAATVYAELCSAGESGIRAFMESVNEKLPKFKKIRRLHIKDDKPGGRMK